MNADERKRDEYSPRDIEPKWQRIWDEQGTFRWDPERPGRKFYCLTMFPYPSGALHMGHVFIYSIGDALVRYHVKRGDSVLSPTGWDGFGLPAENAAIKAGVHPADSTRRNIDRMREQMKRAGWAYDWTRELATCDPEYYRWTQWLFLQFYKAGLAYRKLAPVNWCPSCATVLANEQVIDGACERCGTAVDPRDLVQWFFRMSAYAQRLLDGHAKLTGHWPERVLKMQREWIGRSEGARLDFTIDAPGSAVDQQTLAVFTTRPDTAYGVTFMALAPEHPLVEQLVKGTGREAEVMAAVKTMRSQSMIERTSETSEKMGVFTGRYAVNPFDGAKSQLWVTNYALMEYGTGAVMAVPAHDQRDFLFAKKYGMPIKVVIHPPAPSPRPSPAFGGEGEKGTRSSSPSALPLQSAESGDSHHSPEQAPENGWQSPFSAMQAAYVDQGVQVNSGRFDGLANVEAIRAMTQYAKDQGFGDFTVTYRLKDWLLSRQRYWGAPIPIVYCDRCGEQPVREEDLPVLLPRDVEFRPTGESPLARCPSFVSTTCPKCGGPARREADTIDTFIDSSWYFLRYLTPAKTDGAFDADLAREWLPVHQYLGGFEHSTMHLIYARFFTMVLHDLGLVPFDEPFERLFCQGLVCMTAYRCEEHKWLPLADVDLEALTCKKCGRAVQAEMAKMSKTKLNVVSPDRLFDKYGADTVHTYILSMAPPDRDVIYSEDNVVGISRFLNRLWNTVVEGLPRLGQAAGPRDAELRRKTHQVIKIVTDAFEETFHFNVAIARIMELVNLVREMPEAGGAALREALEAMVQLMSPFAPHVTEELWRRLEHSTSIYREPWPLSDAAIATADEVEIVVQINGKVRARIKVARDLDEASVREQALAESHVAPLLAGKTLKLVKVVPNRLVNIVVG